MTKAQSTTEQSIPNPEQAEEKERAEALRKAYSAATKRLREENRDTFTKLYIEEAKKLGVDYKPKPTEEEKAEAQLAEILAAHPHLRDKVAGAGEQPYDPAQTV